MSSLDAHAEPTLAVSQTSAEGEVNLPQALQELGPDRSYPDSIQNSPVGSRAPSRDGSPQDRLHPVHSFPDTLSRTSSAASVRSVCVAQVARSHSRIRQQQRIVHRSSAEDWQRADDERVRKLIREGSEETDRPVRAFDDRTCPPSPDDQTSKRRESRRPSAFDFSRTASSQASPTGGLTQLPPAMVSSSSDFGSAVSMSISNPSIPSVISEASSLDPSDGMPLEAIDEKAILSSDDTLSTRPVSQDELVDEGYLPEEEQALSSDNDDDYESSSDSDGGLVMTRRRSKASQGGGNGSSSQNTHSKDRPGTNIIRSLEDEP